MKSDYVAPSPSLKDEEDGALAHAIFPSQRALRFMRSIPNLPDLISRQLCGVDLLTTMLTFWMKASRTSIACGLTPLRNHVVGVVLKCSGEEMARIYTGSIVATMANEDSLRNWSVCQSVREAMRCNISIVRPEDAIAASQLTDGPNPARPKLRTVGWHGTVLVDLRPEAGNQPFSSNGSTKQGLACHFAKEALVQLLPCERNEFRGSAIGARARDTDRLGEHLDLLSRVPLGRAVRAAAPLHFTTSTPGQTAIYGKRAAV